MEQESRKCTQKEGTKQQKLKKVTPNDPIKLLSKSYSCVFLVPQVTSRVDITNRLPLSQSTVEEKNLKTSFIRG